MQTMVGDRALLWYIQKCLPPDSQKELARENFFELVALYDQMRDFACVENAIPYEFFGLKGLFCTLLCIISSGMYAWDSC